MTDGLPGFGVHWMREEERTLKIQGSWTGGLMGLSGGRGASREESARRSVGRMATGILDSQSFVGSINVPKLSSFC